MSKRIAGIWIALVSVASPAAIADSVSLAPSKDNTLIQWSAGTEGDNPHFSNALGDLTVGRTGQDGQEAATISIRRGLVRFDIAGAVPSGMMITNATLTMRDVMGLNGDSTVVLHRILEDWGEGSSFFQGGQGAPATEGDATWLYRFYDSDDPAASPAWTTAGGDFSTIVSAESIITDDLGGGQFFSWTGPELVADVQAWLHDPGTNFGWILIGDETRGQSAKQLNSRESTTPPSVPPMLSVEFAPIFAGDYNDDGLVDATDYVVWRDSVETAAPLKNEVMTPGEATIEDYDVWRSQFGAMELGAGSIATIPEPSGLLLVIGGSFGLLGLTFRTRVGRSRAHKFRRSPLFHLNLRRQRAA